MQFITRTGMALLNSAMAKQYDGCFVSVSIQQRNNFEQELSFQSGRRRNRWMELTS